MAILAFIGFLTVVYFLTDGNSKSKKVAKNNYAENVYLEDLFSRSIAASRKSSLTKSDIKKLFDDDLILIDRKEQELLSLKEEIKISYEDEIEMFGEIIESNKPLYEEESKRVESELVNLREKRIELNEKYQQMIKDYPE